MNTGNEGLELRSEDEDKIVGYVDSDAVNKMLSIMSPVRKPVRLQQPTRFFRQSSPHGHLCQKQSKTTRPPSDESVRRLRLSSELLRAVSSRRGFPGEIGELAWIFR